MNWPTMLPLPWRSFVRLFLVPHSELSGVLFSQIKFLGSVITPILTAIAGIPQLHSIASLHSMVWVWI